MSKLLAIAEAVAFEKLVMGGVSMATRKSKAGFGLCAISGILGLVAIGFLIAAFYAWALVIYRPDIAALLTAGVAAGLAVVVAGIAYAVNNKRELERQLRQETMKDDLMGHLKAAIATVDDEFGDQVRENPVMAVLLAGLAGFVAADKIL